MTAQAQARCVMGANFLVRGMIRATLSLALILMLAGCAARGEYPSLAPRPVELASGPAAPAALAPLAPSDPARIARLAAIMARAQAGSRAFADLQQAVSTSAAAAGGLGSESWINAQMALSRLERTREAIQTGLVELDAEKRVMLEGPASADRIDLEATIAAVTALDAAQAAVVRGLIAQISR